MTAVNWPLPLSPDFVIKDTHDSGRAVFATTELTSGKVLLTTANHLSPLAHVILRPYRREVCTQCFSYDRGREWKLRDVATSTAFCTESCQQAWRSANDALTFEAWSIVETFIKAYLKRQGNNNKAPDLDTSNGDHNSGSHLFENVETTWNNTDGLGAEIRKARRMPKPTKHQRAALRRASDLSFDPDVLAYALSGVLAAYKSQHSVNTSDAIDAKTLLPSLYALTPDSAVFHRTPTTLSSLSDYTSSYLVLLAILPGPLIDFLSTDLIINLASRASHNAFSIRPEGISDGDQSGEFLGWGVWPEASFFNHSCRPNVRKERKGRFWSFWVDTNRPDRLVNKGEQLCITYLGGDERDLPVIERRQRLMTQWGFRCCCDRCIEEGEERSPNVSPARVEKA